MTEIKTIQMSIDMSEIEKEAESYIGYLNIHEDGHFNGYITNALTQEASFVFGLNSSDNLRLVVLNNQSQLLINSKKNKQLFFGNVSSFWNIDHSAQASISLEDTKSSIYNVDSDTKDIYDSLRDDIKQLYKFKPEKSYV